MSMRKSMTEHELKEFAKDIYDGGYRGDDLDEIMMQWGAGNKDPMNEHPLSDEDAEKVAVLLYQMDGLNKSRKSVKKSADTISRYRTEMYVAFDGVKDNVADIDGLLGDALRDDYEVEAMDNSGYLLNAARSISNYANDLLDAAQGFNALCESERSHKSSKKSVKKSYDHNYFESMLRDEIELRLHKAGVRLEWFKFRDGGYEIRVMISEADRAYPVLTNCFKAVEPNGDTFFCYDEMISQEDWFIEESARKSRSKM